MFVSWLYAGMLGGHMSITAIVMVVYTNPSCGTCRLVISRWKLEKVAVLERKAVVQTA
jgi:hypothetical protein